LKKQLEKQRHEKTMNKQIIEAREKLGNTIRIIREQKGLSKNKILKETGIQRSQIISIERGSKSYTIDTLLIILNALEVNLRIE